MSSSSDKKKLDELTGRLKTLLQELELGFAIDTRGDVAEILAKLDASDGGRPRPQRRRLNSMTARLQELRPDDVKRVQVIGEGSFGQVWTGKYQTEWVAIKALKTGVAALSVSIVLIQFNIKYPCYFPLNGEVTLSHRGAAVCFCVL